MIIIGGIILYMLLNIYPIIVYIRKIFRMPVEIILLLIPIIGSIYELIIVDFEKKMVPNNRIYRSIFNTNWIYSHLSSVI